MSTQIGKRKGGFYPITTTDGKEHQMISVTSVFQKAVAKPMLIQWAASQERNAVLSAAASLYEHIKNNGSSGDVTQAGFEMALLERIGGFAHRKIFKEAGVIGTAVHKFIEWDLEGRQGKQPEMPEGFEKSIQGWMRWTINHEVKPTYMEFQVFSLKHQYAGTLDFYGKIDGVVEIADWKTSRSIYPEAILQVVSYWTALLEMRPDLPPPEQGRIVCFPKEGDKVEEVIIKAGDRERIFDAFLSALDLWKYLHLGAVEYAAEEI